MSDRGLSQSELARRVGVSQSAIHKLASGGAYGSAHLHKIARQLGTSPSYLTGETDDPAEGATPLPTPEFLAEQLDLVPLEEVDLDYGLGAAYGDTPVSIVVHKMPRLLMEAMSESPSTSLFVTRGVGDSMQPVINHGDLVIIDRSQRIIGRDDGIWALAISGMHTIKRVRIRGEQVRLLSPNPDVSDDVATTDEVHVIGKVVFVGRRM
ncbi:MAG: hypothetical protein DI625_15095 [Sphingomonas sp.]|nr:MAG: hypothetical protein DI625_15095 [Sphingomonas sp.]